MLKWLRYLQLLGKFLDRLVEVFHRFDKDGKGLPEGKD